MHNLFGIHGQPYLVSGVSYSWLDCTFNAKSYDTEKPHPGKAVEREHGFVQSRVSVFFVFYGGYIHSHVVCVDYCYKFSGRICMDIRQ